MMEEFYHPVRYVMKILFLIFKLMSYKEFSKVKIGSEEGKQK